MYRAARAAMFRLDAERAHALTLAALAAASRRESVLGSLRRRWVRRDPRLAVHAFGVTFPNPLGLAAGADKDGRALPAWAAVGFGHVEIGSVTARPQPGSPKPRVFRLPADRAIVNRMGFSSEGADAVAARLASWRERGGWPDVPVGINLGKSMDVPLEDAADDYRASLRALAPYADYLVVNVSSPNTPGLRDLQDEGRLGSLLRTLVAEAGALPLLVKLAPDLSDGALAAAARLAEASGAAGVMAVNTTVTRAGLRVDPREAGGLSGRPLAPRARAALRVLRDATSLPIVSVGGIDSAHEAIRRLESGADLLQLYTGLVYDGPALLQRILDGVTAELERRGLSSVAQLRGGDARPAATGGGDVSDPAPGGRPGA